MSRARALRTLVVLHLLVSTAGLVGCVVLVLTRPDSEPLNAAWVLTMYSFALVGGILGLRLPSHPISWVFIGIGFFGVFEELMLLYAERALLFDPWMPGGLTAGWLSEWTFFPVVFLAFVCLPILFPTGRPATGRGRALLRTGAVTVLVLMTTAAIGPEIGVGSDDVAFANPFAVGGLASVAPVVLVVALILGVAVAVLALASLVARSRRAQGVERQQVKWLTSALGMAGVGFFALILAEAVLGQSTPHLLFMLAWGLAFSAVPVAACMAVLRYRLYDLDRLVSRTLTWALVSGALLVLYVVAAMGFGAALRPIGGSGDLAVAASTLAIAAAFRPLRRRVQGAVDRRFDRARYDAEQTIAAFRDRLRDEMDPRELQHCIVEAVEQTMAPAATSLWVRERVTP